LPTAGPSIPEAVLLLLPISEAELFAGRLLRPLRHSSQAKEGAAEFKKLSLFANGLEGNLSSHRK